MMSIPLLGFDAFRNGVSLSSARTTSPTSFFALILICGSLTADDIRDIGYGCTLGISLKLGRLVSADKAKETGS